MVLLSWLMILPPRWQTYYMNLADQVGTGSKDNSSKIGSVLVRPDKTVASIGFNGFPARITDDDQLLNDPDRREEKYALIVHSEMNCLNHNRDHDTTDFHLIVNRHPCDVCALRIASTGILHIYYRSDEAFEERWKEKIIRAKMIFSKANIAVIEVR